ncbi:MAG: Xaa-Pro dipeptidase [Pseudomonadota bacterium]
MSTDFSDKNPTLAALYGDHIKTVIERHEAALDAAGANHAVVFSGEPHPMFLDDMYYAFKANPHFVSWAPLTALPLSYIVYSRGQKPRLIYLQPKDYWHVVPGEPEGYWVDYFDIEIVHSIDDAGDLLPNDKERTILMGEIISDGYAFGIDRVNPSTAMNKLHYSRGTKTAYELECMRLASMRGAMGHRAAEAAFRDGASEYDIHLAYGKAVSHTDPELPYNNIIALNEHGAVLHYTNLDREAPKDIHSFLIDAGAQVHGYASDITRTYSYGDSRFNDIIARMDQLQSDVCSRIKAGVNYADLHVATHELTANVLLDTELASGSVEELIQSRVTAAFFPHGLGHLIGIQVHDVGGFMMDDTATHIDPPDGHPYLRLTRALEEDMVITVEPGIYVIDMLLDELRGTDAEALINWDTVDWMRPFGGIRIEDDVRVMADGIENLTRNAFAALAA